MILEYCSRLVPPFKPGTGSLSTMNLNYPSSSYQYPGDTGAGASPVTMIVEVANPKFAEECKRSGGIGYIHFKGMPKM
jgi:hypothetical protein